MKKFSKFLILLSFLLLFIACGKKGIYDYSEKEKEDLAYAMIYGPSKEEKEEYIAVINELERLSNDRRIKESEREKAVEELNSWLEKVAIFGEEQYKTIIDNKKVSI